MMNQEGFPKKPVFTAIGVPTLCVNAEPHFFDKLPPIQKYDEEPDEKGEMKTKDIVIYEVMFCRKCLLHVHMEILRKPMREIESGDQLTGFDMSGAQVN